jgi:hypothetical protein
MASALTQLEETTTPEDTVKITRLVRELAKAIKAVTGIS